MHFIIFNIKDERFYILNELSHFSISIIFDNKNILILFLL